MKPRAFAITAAALALGTVLAILVPASPAVGFFSPPLLLDVQIQPTATVVARGAAVEARVEVTCAGASYAYVNMSITQRVGSEVASGGTSTQVACGPQRQTLLMLVTAQPGKAFRKGTAVAEAYISGCAPNGPCGSETDTATIDINQ